MYRYRGNLYVQGRTGSAVVGLDPVFLYATISWYMKRGRKERQCGMNTEPVHAIKYNGLRAVIYMDSHSVCRI